MGLELNVGNFFRELYFCPSKTDDYYTSLACSVALGVFTLGAVPVVVGICWVAKPTFVWIKEIIEATIQKTSEVGKSILQQEGIHRIEPSKEVLLRKEFFEKIKESFKSAHPYSSSQKMKPETMTHSIMRTMKDGVPLLVLKVTYANPEEHYEKHILPYEKRMKSPKDEALKQQFLIGIYQKSESTFMMDLQEIETPFYKYERETQPFFQHRGYPYYLDKENSEQDQVVSGFFLSLLTNGIAKDFGGNEWKLV